MSGRVRAGRAVGRLAPLVLAVALVTWIRVLPLSLPDAAAPELLRYRGADGRQHVYLGDFDSYLWLRLARNRLRTGRECERIAAGECRDTLAHAPVGRRMQYAGSLHVAAIVALHRVLEGWRPGYPLAATAYWIPVLAGALGVAAAFAVGARLAGPLGGLVAAVASGVNPLLLHRSLGADNDVWNVALPLCAVWALVAAVTTRRGALGRAALALLAAGVVLAHAFIWSGWVVVYVAALGALALYALLAALRVLRAPPWRAGVERRTLVEAAVVLAVCGLGVSVGSVVAGADPGPRVLPGLVLAALGPPPPPPVPDLAALWPDAFATVGELIQPDLRWIARTMGGDLWFFVGWLGLLLLVLPRRRWRWWHFVLLVGGNYLYRWLLAYGAGSPATLVALLALPVVAGAVGWVAARGVDRDAAGGLVVAVWFLATLFVAFGGQRFVMLLVPAFAVVLGVAVGRLHLWLASLARRVAGARTAAWVGPALGATLALVLVPLWRDGRAAATEYRPRMSDAWWDTLARVRERTPPETIVNTWWDFGHWVTYVAGRRASADGASLRTHVPHWLARALLAPREEETIGLLRMLNCGSDATPEPEGARGAYGRLRAHGMDHVAAYEAVAAVAPLARAAAHARLAALGLDDAAVEDVLEVTHCTPPPALLLLTSRMARTGGWWSLGTWEIRRAYAAEVARRLPEGAAIADLGARFALAPSAARALWSAGVALAASPAGPAAELDYLSADWLPCETAAGEVWTCPVGAPTGAGGVLEAVAFAPEAPLRAPLVVRRGGRRELATPAAAILDAADGRREVEFPGATFPELAVLVDLPGRRVLLGAPRILRSTFTRLVFLDGRHLRRLEPFDARDGPGERVLAWWVCPDE